MSSSRRGDHSRSATGEPSTRSNDGRRSAHGAPGTARGLTIKPFKRAPTVPTEFATRARETLREAIRRVQAKEVTGVSHEALYRHVENLCVHRRAAEAFEDFQSGADRRAREVLRGLEGRKIEDSGVFLTKFDETWGDYCAQALTLRSIFLYLDRAQANGGGKSSTLWDVSLRVFHEHLEGTAKSVKGKVVRGLLDLVERERMGEKIDRALAKRVLRALSALGVYQEAFENVFIEASQEFYRKEGNEYSVQTDVSDYLKHCERRLEEEAERCANYLDAGTAKALMRTCEQGLIEAHIGDILDKGFVDLMRQHRLEDLRRLHSLLARMDGLGRLCSAFVTYLKQQGTAIVKDEARDKDMVDRLLTMKTAVDEVVSKSFGRTIADGSNDIFINGVKESFESFINCRQNVPAELIAKYIDSKLKSGSKGLSEEELERTLDKALTLFRYIVGKDVFEVFYKKELSKRLLHGKSASIDAERSMIQKLKAECGSQFTQHLEGMFKDIDLSREIMQSFRQTFENDPIIEMNVNVITAGCWPSYPSVDVKLPEELANLQEKFMSFYLGKHSGRKLTWQNSEGHCVLKARFDGGMKELSVSLFQCVILMLFNDSKKLSYTEIAQKTGMEEKELKRALQSLACAKVRILNKEPKSREINDDDSFEVNTALNERLFRIKVNSIQVKETAEENKQTMERVFQDRQQQIDAAIVRVMKTRKSLTHALLISELMAQLKFPTKASDLKKRIESLIEREYLERDREDAQTYNYLA
ncbi:Cullin repeat-like-containing domain [Ostreococcus tauri]|uniref:Cullin repeat-like-containing domain n=1 Tax=Ostreococcus tauri TaxID=70448 RepID=A0A090N334_OSTTA|nr:Cullin repeat-like-containing domain [Ostreococcus tauri]CEF97423.1 Cullin repeat-like-containing domain [Ostreococcus tauri]|eukprot:XP_022838681.1 Cullin repeat-like-containing domain [Ostreococcus tauri]